MTVHFDTFEQAYEYYGAILNHIVSKTGHFDWWTVADALVHCGEYLNDADRAYVQDWLKAHA